MKIDNSLAGYVRRTDDRESPNDRLRRLLPLAVRPGEGRFTKPTAAV